MALTRNTIEKDVAQNKEVIKQTDPYESTRRSIKLAEAGTEFEKTGEYGTYKDTTAKIQEKTLGGSAEQYNVKQTRSNVEDSDYARRVKLAQAAYEENPNEETAAALKSEIETGYTKYSKESSTGVNITSAIRNVSLSENTRILSDLESNWKTDPETYKDEYTAELERQIAYYGDSSTTSVTLKEKLRGVEEESLLNTIRNATLEYEKDPANNYDQLVSARNALIDFYGSSEDGYYAKVALNELSEEEQTRLDDEASTKYESGEIGYDAYYSYLSASMSKYAEGSEEYMKYYEASSNIKFSKELDDLISLQYSLPTGQVQQALIDFQAQFAEGSTTYNEVQDQIDSLEEQIRQNAYDEMIKSVISERQEEINELESKLYVLQQDYESGEISESTFKKKYQQYSNKIDYLSDTNTLPDFELWQTYDEWR